jgi:hypothetical protein
MEAFEIVLVSSLIFSVLVVGGVMYFVKQTSKKNLAQKTEHDRVVKTMKRTIEVQDEALDIYREML